MSLPPPTPSRRGWAAAAAGVLALATVLVVAMPAGAAPSLSAASCAQPGGSLTVAGSGFQPGLVVDVVAFGVVYKPPTSGSFSLSIPVPAATSPGTYSISANHAAGSASTSVAVPCQEPPPTTTTEPPATTAPATTAPRAPTTTRAPATTLPPPTPTSTTVVVDGPRLTLRPDGGPPGAMVAVEGEAISGPCELSVAGFLVVPSQACAPGEGGRLDTTFAIPELEAGDHPVLLTGLDLNGVPAQTSATLTVTTCRLPPGSALLGLDPREGPPGTRVLVTLAWTGVPPGCAGLPVDLRFMGTTLGQGVANGPGLVFEAYVPERAEEGSVDLELVEPGSEGAVVASLDFQVLQGAPDAGSSSPWLVLGLVMVAMAVVFFAAVGIGAIRTSPVAEPVPVLGGGEEVGDDDERPRVRPNRRNVGDHLDWRAVATAAAVGLVGVFILVRVVADSGDRVRGPAESRELTRVLPSEVDVAASSSQVDEVVADLVFTYGPDNTLDGDTRTAWSHGSPGQGVGERLVYTFDEPVELVMIDVSNGFDLSQEVYFRNGRVEDLAVITDAGTQTFTLTDTPEPQRLEGDFAGETTSVVLEVRSVYPGTEFNGLPAFEDVSISEVALYVR